MQLEYAMMKARYISAARVWRPAILIILLCALAAGCAPSSAPPMMVRHWVLEYQPPRLEGLDALPATMRVNRLSAAYGFNSQEMIYRPSPHERGTYPYQRWMAIPSDLFGDLLARDLRNSGLFSAVLSGNEQGSARFRVEGGVLEFLELDQPGGWKARLALHFTLLDMQAPGTDTRVVMQKDYSHEAEIDEKGAPGLAQAMSQAARAVSADIIKDIHQAIRERIR
jgi:ABC-type uncharacterized transport system auxiliary subunit